MASPKHFAAFTDVDYFQGMADEVCEEMMVALRGSLHQAARACANVCLERMEKEMVRRVYEAQRMASALHEVRRRSEQYKATAQLLVPPLPETIHAQTEVFVLDDNSTTDEAASLSLGDHDGHEEPKTGSTSACASEEGTQSHSTSDTPKSTDELPGSDPMGDWAVPPSNSPVTPPVQRALATASGPDVFMASSKSPPRTHGAIFDLKALGTPSTPQQAAAGQVDAESPDGERSTEVRKTLDDSLALQLQIIEPRPREVFYNPGGFVTSNPLKFDAPVLEGHNFTIMANVKMQTSDKQRRAHFAAESLGEILGWANKPETSGVKWRAREFRVSHQGFLCFGQVVDRDFTCLTASSHRINDGKAHHVAVTKFGSEVRLFVDGEQVREGFLPRSAHIGKHDVNRECFTARWHHRHGYDMVWEGSVREVRLFDDALNPAEIRGYM